jgi:hypothetical protein
MVDFWIEPMLEKRHAPYAKVSFHIRDSPGLSGKDVIVKRERSGNVRALILKAAIGVEVDRWNVPVLAVSQQSWMHGLSFENENSVRAERA